METLTLLLFLHVVVVCAVLATRALHAKLSPLATVLDQGGSAAAAAVLSTLPSGRQLEEYVQAGLVDLRIMLVQAARRRQE